MKIPPSRESRNAVKEKSRGVQESAGERNPKRYAERKRMVQKSKIRQKREEKR